MEPLSSFEDQLAALLPRLRRFAHALSRNPADADDLTQATIERALRSRGQWEPGTRLDSWLYRIMRNLWIDTVRSRGRREEQREIVALILIEGFGYRECSEILGLPIGTVSSRLVRGRTALLQMLGGSN